ncbi:polysaccharide lyase [Mariniblastus fucicola]|nr:NosD domain-containing protein [Mariniblastus fucicola]
MRYASIFGATSRFALKSAFLSGVLLLVLLAASQSDAQLIYQNDFDQYTTERVYTDDDLDNDFNEPRFNDGVTEGRVTIVGASQAHGGAGSALAIAYPAGEDGTKQTGAQWQLDFDNSYEELYFSYCVKFESGFDFVRGGKLPGLAGGTAPTGSTQADGTNGWNGRMMWRTDFEGVSGQPEQLTSDAISYAKYTDSGFDGTGRDEDKEYWVESDGSRTTIKSGVWYEIIQRVKMNDPGESNGVLQIWIDGRLVHDQQDVLFRTANTFAIDQVYFSTFFGGNEDWRTSKDEVAYFDDFKVGLLLSDLKPEPEPEPRFLKVPQHFPTVQEAIDDANPGDTVAVRGFLRENIVVNKAIFLRGYNGTRINALDVNSPAIRITASGVHLKRFELRYGPHAVVVDPGLNDITVEYITAIFNSDSAICLKEGNDGALVRKNQVYYAQSDGIRIDRSDDVTVIDNKVFTTDGTGFSIFGSNDVTVEGNTSWGNHEGFCVDGNGSTIEDNFAFKNSSSGFVFSGDNLAVIDNYSRLNGSHGYSFFNSSHNSINENVSRENGGNGFEFTAISDNSVMVDNIAKLCGEVGFFLDFASGNSIDDALSLDNESGFVLTGTTSSNTITRSLAQDNPVYGVLDQGTGNDTSGVKKRRNGND